MSGKKCVLLSRVVVKRESSLKFEENRKESNGPYITNELKVQV